MSKIKPAAFVMVLASLAIAGCGKEARKLYDKAGGFSYDPPAGWTIAEIPGMKYKIARGTPANGFAPNINVVDENFGGSLTDYADQNVAMLKKVFSGLKVVRQDTLTTSDGQPGVRAIVEDEQVGRKLRQTFYFFGNGSRKYVATCSTLADGGEKLDKGFEDSMTTFRMH